MPAYAVIGAQWGDEGKGKVVDLLAEKADVVARFSGGNNAGHTIVRDEEDTEIKLHLVPCGILRPQVTNVIGNGVVLNLDVLIEELEGLAKMGFDGRRRILVSDRAHLVMPYHIELDHLQEKARGNDALGTTKRGIGPAYIDKFARTGIRVGELQELDTLLRRIPELVARANKTISAVYEGDRFVEEDLVVEKVRTWAKYTEDMIGKSENLIHDSLASNRNVIFEGSQGTLIDIDHGTYPYVTSASCTVGGVLTGLGLGPQSFSEVSGVFKAYCTRVGAGPMPTEIAGDEADGLRRRASEFGSTTGRPRRIGWFDAVAGKYAATVNGLNSIILTRLDILDGLEQVPICVAYKLNGETVTRFPQDCANLERCEPIYEYMPGWNDSTAGIVSREQLPGNAYNYIRAIERYVGAEVKVISTGPRRSEAVFLKQLLG